MNLSFPLPQTDWNDLQKQVDEICKTRPGIINAKVVPGEFVYPYTLEPKVVFQTDWGVEFIRTFKEFICPASQRQIPITQPTSRDN